MKKIIFMAALSTIFFSGCVGKIVSAPFKVAGEVIDAVLP